PVRNAPREKTRAGARRAADERGARAGGARHRAGDEPQCAAAAAADKCRRPVPRFQEGGSVRNPGLSPPPNELRKKDFSAEVAEDARERNGFLRAFGA